MADKKEERYTLMGPGGKISAIVMEAEEFNLFGNSCITIITRETDRYPVIPDEPGHLSGCQRQQTGWWKTTRKPEMTGAGETLH